MALSKIQMGQNKMLDHKRIKPRLGFVFFNVRFSDVKNKAVTVK